MIYTASIKKLSSIFEYFREIHIVELYLYWQLHYLSSAALHYMKLQKHTNK